MRSYDSDEQSLSLHFKVGVRSRKSRAFFCLIVVFSCSEIIFLCLFLCFYSSYSKSVLNWEGTNTTHNCPCLYSSRSEIALKLLIFSCLIHLFFDAPIIKSFGPCSFHFIVNQYSIKREQINTIQDYLYRYSSRSKWNLENLAILFKY